MGRLSIDCERAHLWVSLAVDAEISELERSSLRAHLGSCAACAAYARQVEELVQLVRRAPAAAPASALSAPAGRRRTVGRMQLAASAAAVVAALALGSLAGTLTSRSPGGQVRGDAAAHRLLIQQSLLALMAASPGSTGHGGRIVPS